MDALLTTWHAHEDELLGDEAVARERAQQGTIRASLSKMQLHASLSASLPQLQTADSMESLEALEGVGMPEIVFKRTLGEGDGADLRSEPGAAAS